MTIFADGRVKAEVPEGLGSLSAQELTQYVRSRGDAAKTELPGFNVLEGKLSRAELEELMRFVVFEQEFLTIDADAVKSAIGRVYHSDGRFSTVRIRRRAFMVQTADKNTISWRG